MTKLVVNFRNIS